MLSGVWQILTTQDTQDSLGQFALLNFVKLALIEFAGLEKRLDSAFTRVCNVQQGWEAPAVQWSLGVFFVQSSDLLHWHASIQRLLVLNTSTHILPRPAIENAKQENVRHWVFVFNPSDVASHGLNTFNFFKNILWSDARPRCLYFDLDGPPCYKGRAAIRQDPSSYQTCPGWMAWGAGLGVEFGD